MPKEEYSLLLGDDVYADLIQYQYDSSRWMNMQPVPAEAIKIRRSSKKIEELCRKGVMLKDDTLTMKKAGMDGIVIAFTATVGKQSFSTAIKS